VPEDGPHCIYGRHKPKYENHGTDRDTEQVVSPCPGQAFVGILDYLQHCRAVYGGVSFVSTLTDETRGFHNPAGFWL